jgi:hypothetical protein
MLKSSNPKPTHQSKWKLDTHIWRWYVWHPKIKEVNLYATLLIQAYAVIRLRMTCNVVSPLETWVVNKHEYVRYDFNRKSIPPSLQSIISKYSYVFKTIHKHIHWEFQPPLFVGHTTALFMHCGKKITYRLSSDILLISYAVLDYCYGSATMLLPKYTWIEISVLLYVYVFMILWILQFYKVKRQSNKKTDYKH